MFNLCRGSRTGERKGIKRKGSGHAKAGNKSGWVWNRSFRSVGDMATFRMLCKPVQLMWLSVEMRAYLGLKKVQTSENLAAVKVITRRNLVIALLVAT